MNTMRNRIWVGLMLLIPMFVSGMAARAGGATSPQAAEIINILKTRYVDHNTFNQEFFNDATVTGVVQALGAGAAILTPEPADTNVAAVSASNATAVAPLARAEVIEPDIGYIRLADVTEETPAALDVELKKFSAGKVTGCVLDLRFADGTNYAATSAVASRFLPENRELFTMKRAQGGAEIFRTHLAATTGFAQSDAPLLVLVNGQTRGCAEALAGALRAQDRCIMIGNQTAGSAAAWDDVPLNDGRVLRVASAKIVLAPPGAGRAPNLSGNTVAPSTGAEQVGVSVFPGGLTPDIRVKIDPRVERDMVLNASTNVSLAASLQPYQFPKGMGEAELVKAFRGEVLEMEKPVTESVTEKACDTVLQRAVDVLKGIRALVSWQ